MNQDWAALARRVVQGAAMVACAAGIGVWAAVLLAPAPAAPPPALTQEVADTTDTGPIAGWFGAGPASRVQLVPSGLIAAGAASSAILSVDGGRPRAYGVGQALAQDLVLTEVLPTGVVVAQGGQYAEISVKSLPPVSGIVPAATAPVD